MSRSERFNKAIQDHLSHFYRTFGRQQRSYRVFRELHDVNVSSSERCSTLFYDQRPRFIGLLFKPLHRPVPRSTCGVPTTYPRRIIYGSACLQRHETRRLTGRALARSVAATPFVLLLLLPLTRLLLKLCVRFECFVVVIVVHLASRCLFLALTFWFAPFSASTRISVLVSVCCSVLPAIDLTRSMFVTRPKLCGGSVFFPLV